MIDLEQALRDQDDLETLCSGVLNNPVSESFTYNEGYGFARVLKQYSGYSLDQPINAIIPHGIYLNASEMLVPEQRSNLPAVLNYPAFRAGVWEKETDKVIIPSASPFLYALSMFRSGFPEHAAPKGTIFFPAHTIQFSQTNTDWDAVIEELLALDECFQPVTCCIHFKDYIDGLHTRFTQRSIRVVSAGNGWDPEFMYRWLHLVSGHEYAASNDVGSAVIYASKFGLPVRTLDNVAGHFLVPELHVLQRSEQLAQVKETKQRIAELFTNDFTNSESGLTETIDYLLGAENAKSPDDLRAELEYVANLTSSG